MIDSFITEFRRYRATAEKTLAQISDDALNQLPTPNGNSVAMIIRHLSGNFMSRFTDFLTSDGEKPWRHRDGEFETRSYSRTEVERMWLQGWSVLDHALEQLTDADLERRVRIRGIELTVAEALARSASHLAYHVGQIVLIARVDQGDQWAWISVAKGDSEAYNRHPDKEKSI